MILCPNAKINLGLEVVRRRPDGFHDIESVFLPVPELCDVLDVVHADKAELTVYGTPCDVPPEKNLCFKAFRLMQREFGIGDVHIFLYKKIPMGAGLGGGSSDAAFTLVALNEIFQLGLGRERLASLAATLGRDCPFFIYNRPMLATGRGEILTPVELDMTPYRVEVVTPGIHISTPEAYAGVDAIKDLSTSLEMTKGPIEKTKSITARLSHPISTWRENVVNDFEAFAFAKYPILADIKQQLYTRGAIYASMTGSGSAIYGIFKK